MTRGPLSFLSILIALACSSCVTFKEQEMETIRACRVSPAVYRKLVERQVVTPFDIAELWQKRVPSALIEKQLDKVGVDYALRQSDVSLLEAAGVGDGVMDALRAASERYVARYAPPEFVEASATGSDEYLGAAPIRASGGLLYGRDILQR